MKMLEKIVTVFGAIGFIMLAIAAALQNYDINRADLFGYLGVALLVSNTIIIVAVAAIATWNKQFKNYLFSSVTAK
jgi:hypothetical protein